MIFDSFRVEHVPKELKKLKGNKNITINIYKMQASDSVICKYFCIRFINFIPIYFPLSTMERIIK